MLHTFDITRARQETLACQNIIHFNNAGASLMPTPVSQALHRYLHQEERMGGYETEAFYKASLNNTYASAAKLLNCSAHEIAFVENATRAWEMAFYSFKFNPGDKILTTLAEYGSNVVAYIQQSQRLGVEVVFVPNDEFGQMADLFNQFMERMQGSMSLIGEQAQSIGVAARNLDQLSHDLEQTARTHRRHDARAEAALLAHDRVDECGRDTSRGLGRSIHQGQVGRRPSVPPEILEMADRSARKGLGVALHNDSMCQVIVARIAGQMGQVQAVGESPNSAGQPLDLGSGLVVEPRLEQNSGPFKLPGFQSPATLGDTGFELLRREGSASSAA